MDETIRILQNYTVLLPRKSYPAQFSFQLDARIRFIYLLIRFICGASL
jgi:hypothetical protein